MSGNIITKKKNTNNDKKGEPKRKNSKAKTKKTKKKVISKILTHAGYALVKEHFGFRAINRCKKDLNVKPYVPPDFGTPDSYPVYLENTRKIYCYRMV